MALTKTLHNKRIYRLNNLTGVWMLESTTGVYSQGYEDETPITGKTPKAIWRPPQPFERKVQVLGPYTRVLDAERNHWRYDTVRFLAVDAISDGFGKLFPGLPAFPSNLEARAVNAALSSLKQQKIHLGVAFGERRQTAAFVTDTVGEMRQLYRSVRRGDLKGVKHQLWRRYKKQRHYRSTLHEVLDAPSALLLKNTYALKPLVADVYGALEVLNDKDRADPTRYATRTRVAMKGEPFTLRSEFGETNYSTTIYWDVEQVGYHVVIVRLDYYLKNPFLASLASAGVTNPLELAWELIPFSFVVDWLLPVQSYLSTLDADLGMQFRGGSITQTTKTKVALLPGTKAPMVQSSDINWKVKIYQQKETTGRGSRQSWTKRRILLHSPSGRLPSFKNPFSYPKLAIAIALLAQLTQRPLRKIRRVNRV